MMTMNVPLTVAILLLDVLMKLLFALMVMLVLLILVTLNMDAVHPLFLVMITMLVLRMNVPPIQDVSITPLIVTITTNVL
jgi:hypothetical protein